MRRYPQILSAVCGAAWAILPEKLEAIIAVLEARVSGTMWTADEMRARMDAGNGRPRARRGGAVAVLPLVGILAQRAGMMTEMSGGTSTDEFGAMFDAAVADPQVGAVVLDVDSPGGAVYGVEELSVKIFGARGQKPIYAVANSLAASAAYWVASAADKLYVTPGGDVGSIGVIAVHTDTSAADEAAGLKHTLVKAGKHKGEGNPLEPLGDDARADLQKRVDQAYTSFLGSVARNRGVRIAAVRSGYGEGRLVGAAEAKEEGMVDGIATLEQVVGSLMPRRTVSTDTRRRRAALQS